MPKSTVVQDVVLPELDVTNEDWLASAKEAGSMLRNNEDRAAIAFYKRHLKLALTQLAELTPEIEKLKGRRVHTQEWYASHYAKLHDWAREVLPEPYRNQFFSCVANGTYDGMLDVGEPYMCKAGFMVTPSGYIPMDDAKGQIIREQTARAEDAESQLAELRAASEEARTLLRNIENRLDPEWPIAQDIEAWLQKTQPSPASAVEANDDASL